MKLGAKQLKLIRDQQIRDDNMQRRINKTRIKKIRKGAKKVGRKLPSQVLAELDF